MPIKNCGVVLCVLVSAALVGCATTAVSEFSAPDGTKAKSVKCNSDPQKCFSAATASCSEGTYRVISSESHAGGILADIIPGPVTWYGMAYVCGQSDGRMPDFKFQGAQYVAPAMTGNEFATKSKPVRTNCQIDSYTNTANCVSR